MNKKFFFSLFIISFVLLYSFTSFAQKEKKVLIKNQYEKNFCLKKIHHTIKKYCIEGGIILMSTLLILLAFGLSLVFEKALLFYLYTVSIKRFFARIKPLLDEENYNEVKNICKKTRGPVAAVLLQGIMYIDKDPLFIKNMMKDYAQLLITQLEKRMSWIAFIITLAPMIGFLGTVLGMVEAFEAIVTANSISPIIIASGMKVALITTIAGLIVAIVLQVFYAILSSKIDSLIENTEEAMIKFIQLLYIKQ